MSNTRCCKRKQKIPIVIVESHQHVLEHIHHILRQRKILSDWSMLHFDSHADLACPPHVPAISCFRPRQRFEQIEQSSNALDSKEKTNSDEDSESSSYDDDDDDDHPITGSNDCERKKKKKNLYEMLDCTTSGIAEWIIPLVFGANLRHIHWIRPNGTTIRQIPCGDHHYNVGAWKPSQEMISNEINTFLDLSTMEKVKVDALFPYYLEDDSCVPTSELLLASPLHLQVSEGPSELREQLLQKSINSKESLNRSASFALDVCLDYFLCINPFLADIQVCDEEFASALQNAVIESNLWDIKLPQNLQESTFRSDLILFQEELKQVVEYMTENLSFEPVSSNAIINRFYESSEIACRAMGRINETLRRCDESKQRKLVSMAVEAIPNLCMPHDVTAATKTFNDGSIQERFVHFRSVIETYPKPFIITIARSTIDGFTSRNVVEDLQKEVLNVIHYTYCDCSQPNLNPNESINTECCLQLLLDYEYGEFEGSYMRVH